MANTQAPDSTDAATKATDEEGDRQRDSLLEAQREANAGEPRNFKDDALTDKVVTVGPDGTGPTSTRTFDAPTDIKQGSGSPPPAKV